MTPGLKRSRRKWDKWFIPFQGKQCGFLRRYKNPQDNSPTPPLPVCDYHQPEKSCNLVFKLIIFWLILDNFILSIFIF